jgi:hypothetical protein
MPLVFGILAFCFSGHSVFPSVQNAMTHPEQFPAVLNTAFAIVATLCTFVGVAGYYMYGAGALDVITFNMHAGKLKSLCAAVILVNPFAKFAITMEPIALAMRHKTSRKLKVQESYLFRCGTVTVLLSDTALSLCRLAHCSLAPRDALSPLAQAM